MNGQTNGSTNGHRAKKAVHFGAGNIGTFMFISRLLPPVSKV